MIIIDSHIKYEVRYRCRSVSGIGVLPVWIPIDSSPVEYVSKILRDTCPRGFEIINIKVWNEENKISIDTDYINRIINMVSEVEV